jgi:hypothetical protein
VIRTGIERRFVVCALAALVVLPVVVVLGAVALGASPLVMAALGGAVVVALGAAHVAPFSRLATRLPADWDGALRRRPGLAWGWAALALVGTVQVTRLACFMADPSLSWGSAFPPVPEGVRHACLSAYVHAADLQRRGEPNVYAESHYPAFHGGRLGHAPSMVSPVRNLGPWLEDPFEYPPPFLLLPRAALALTDDFLVIRAIWFALKLVLVALAALAVARALGGARGRVLLLLMSALFASLPFMFDLQFGQFHLVTIALSVLGMLALERQDRPAQLALGLLLLHLAVARRGRAVAATVLACAVWAGLALAVLGPAPFRAFVEYQLPRIASGEAFSFFMRSDLTIAANWGLYGVPIKLGRLGVPGMSTGVAAWLSWLYTVPLLMVTVWTARRARPWSPAPLLWLALLRLGSLRSPLAPNVYVGAPALWLLAGHAVEVRGRPLRVAALVVVWLLIGGLPPLGTPEATIVGWMTGQVAMLALGFWSLARRASDA